MKAPLTLLAGLAATLPAQGTESRATEHTLPSHDRSPYFVVPPRDAAAGKRREAGLVVVLPGGPGTRDFLPWAENGILGAAPDDCVGVMLTAVSWGRGQRAIWPVEKADAPGMEYTTSDQVRAVVAAVEESWRVDPDRRVVVAWSSSGPAVYRLMAEKDSPFDRAYVAMSVWPADLTKPRAARKRRFFLDQSPEDQRTTFRHVRRAFSRLDEAGAVVRLSTYEGGHGWQDAPIPRIRDGLRWLLGDEPAPAPEWPPPPIASSRGRVVNLISNPGFERGLAVWDRRGNSGRCEFGVSATDKTEGEQALHVQKRGGAPLDLLTQEVELPKGRTVTVSLRLKSRAARNARIKVWLYDEDDEPVHRTVDLVAIPTDSDWHAVEKSWPQKRATYAVVQVMMVLPGEVWLDDVVLRVEK